MLSDIEIAQSANIKDIKTILGAEYESMIEPYGKDMGKISYTYIDEDKIRQSNLILVTAITPTKAGIGKTTVSIGLNDGLRKLGKSSIAVLREPSLGPCFGMKGGACGGGYSQVVPMEKINFHFTGDFHAITCANNMLAAALDNHLYHNADIRENIKRLLFKRCIDINDRSLRRIYYKISPKDTDMVQTGFNITPASEIMAIFCLSNNIEELRQRLDNIILAEYKDGTYLYAKELNITGSLIALLSEAFKPNIVQSLENNPVIIHGGPFANIAHGCNSIVATKLGMTLCDYVVTEAGFAAELGAEKFWNIKCRRMGISDELKCVVLVCTIPGLKQFTGNIADGYGNLLAHYNMLKKHGFNVVVTCNVHLDKDTEDDKKSLVEFCKQHDIAFEFNTCFAHGGEGAIGLARKVIETISASGKNNKTHTYEKSGSLITKIENILTKVYGYNPETLNIVIKDGLAGTVEGIASNPMFADYDVCIAKTQYSMNDDVDTPTTTPGKTTFTITDIEVSNGAGFIVVSAGNMLRMPGLPKIPSATKIDFIDNKITGLS